MRTSYKGLNVLGVLADMGACGWYRLEFPFAALRKLGINAQTTLETTVRLVFDSDVTVLQRMFDPELYTMIQEMRSKRGARKTILYEIDDYLDGIHPSSPAYKTFYPGSPILNQFKSYMTNSDGLFTSTHELHTRYGNVAKKSWVIPNCIDFGLREWYVKPPRHPKLVDKLVIGWAGSSFHPDDILPFKPALHKVLKDRSDSVVALCSGPQQVQNFLNVLNLPSDRYVILDPVHFWFYPSLISQFDIGLAPLLSNQFNICKCVDRSTIVGTTSGLKEIASISTGDNLLDYVSKYTKVLAVENSSQTVGLKLTTINGYSIVVTKEHRLLTHHAENVEDYIWEEAQNLEVGDHLWLTPLRFSTRTVDIVLNVFDNNKSLLQPSVSPINSNNIPRLTVTHQVAAMMGILVANQFSEKTGYKLPSTQFNKIVITEFLRSLGILVDEDDSSLSRNCNINSKTIRFVNKHLISVLDYLTDNFRTIILSSPRHVIKRFISSYSLANVCISYTEQCISFNGLQSDLQVIQLLLLGFNIISQLNETTLCLYGDNISRFIVNIWSSDLLYTHKHVIYSGISKYPLCSWNVSREVITSIEEVPIEPVDIQTLSGSFIANGFISHNSNLKLLEYGAWGIPYAASLVAPYARFSSETKNSCGVLMRTDDYKGLLRLALDDSYRNDCGNNIKDHIHENYNLEIAGKTMAQSILEALEMKETSKTMQGLIPPIRNSPGRNTPCPCNSGKKYKSCCYPAWN